MSSSTADQQQSSPGNSKQPSPSQLRYITEGTFGRIYTCNGTNVVYKMVKESSRGPKLKEEYTIYDEVHRSLDGAVFKVPRPFEYYSPPYQDDLSSSAPSSTTPTYNTPQEFDFNFVFPAFSMSLIPPLDPIITETYKSVFWSNELQRETHEIRLFRLYLGREDIPTVTQAIQPGVQTDPPLDIGRYEKLSAALTVRYGGEWELPDPKVIAWNVGEVLARLHWMGGDFNQCQRFLPPRTLHSLSTSPSSHSPQPTTGMYAANTLFQTMKRLATLIYTQEMYYPRPHQIEHYTQFKRGYVDIVEAILQNGLGGLGEDLKRDIIQAARGFFEEYERLDCEKMARKSRMGKKVVA
ncbi:hypothetical protein I302_102893 [Kwoniella bestiolae CBS 10118]|uniref:Uncharacterized protein n=1 Tax=Kwoniella bestiolae CBS 10118 TaxID=1296100 RepID=A0A1B9GGA5_9TREE|nr:hypothetical protein I302_01588 [Kwoniella bestiolae CBS 10118]OCF30069.1 hypothetical protein I302_01588 [Kwoniella bestiolae CBS 10118]